MVHVPLMFLSEWREFPLAPCLAGKKTWWQLEFPCCWNCARCLTRFLSASVTRKDLQFGTWTDLSFQRHYRFCPTTSGPPRRPMVTRRSIKICQFITLLIQSKTTSGVELPPEISPSWCQLQSIGRGVINLISKIYDPTASEEKYLIRDKRGISCLNHNVTWGISQM